MRPVAAACSVTEQSFRFKEAGLVGDTNGGRFRGRRLWGNGIAIGKHMQRVGSGMIEIVGSDKVFGEIDVLSFEMSCHDVRRVLVELQRKCLCRCLEVS